MSNHELGASNPAPPLRQADPPWQFDRNRLFAIFFFVIYAVLIYQLLRILSPFVAPLLSAVMLALVVFPVLPLIKRVIPNATGASLLTTIFAVVTVVLPITVLIWVLLREAEAAVPALGAWLTTQDGPGQALVQGHLPGPIALMWEKLTGYGALVGLNFRTIALEAVREIGNRVTLIGAMVVREFFVFLFQAVIFVFALFFFLRDGPRMIENLLDFVPMETPNKLLILQSLDRTLVGIVRGTVVTASAQGAMTGIGLALFGAPFPVLLGFAATLFSIVPVVGAAVVWVPAATYLLLTDHTGAGIGLILWGLLVVGLIDNLLRPLVVGQHSRLPITLLFLGVLGGVQVYGLIGGILSPLLIACVFAFARIYRERYVGLPTSL